MSSERSSSGAAVPAQQFLSDVLKPGFSLNPLFLLVLDCTFAVLLLTFIALLFISGTLHIVVLIIIELCLWIVVKWFVHELKNALDHDKVQSEPNQHNGSKKIQ